MVFRKRLHWPIVLGIGVVAGLVLGGFWPYSPLHAVSTDRIDTFAIATGPVDNEVEAVYILDFLTGELGAVVLGNQVGTWNGFFKGSVTADLMINPQKNPKYLMVTGRANLRHTGGTRAQPSTAVCYVAEVTSGKIVAYAIPWQTSMFSAGQPQTGKLVPVGVTQWRRDTGAGMGTGLGTGPRVRGRDRGD
jgi:hypothetical protein